MEAQRGGTLAARELPVGAVDPAARERELERRQDEIEFLVAQLDAEFQ
ncbi:MAG: hypothetical protein IT432_15980 [Phycisphaerales bacterium]|nr:hypothetical protein [Phycisphaerales bacterium]